MTNGSENINNKVEAKVNPMEQGAVNTIKNTEDPTAAIDNKFPKPQEINKKLKGDADQKKQEKQESGSVLKDIQDRLSKEITDNGPDKQEKTDYKDYIEKSYTQDMNNIINQIKAANIGGSEDQKLLGDDAIYRISPLSIKSWATYVNFNIANNNFKKNTDIKAIDIPKLMKCFVETQDVLLTHTKVEIIPNPTIKFENSTQLQNTGEFIPVAQQEKIKQSFQNLIDKKQEITGFRLYGKADATGPKTREIPENQINKSKTSLLQKGLDPKILNNIELANGTKINGNFFDGVDKLTGLDQKNQLNKAWAYARALMQIDFLSTEQLQKINESQKFKIILTPQPVNLDPNNKENKGAKYTGGGIEIDTKGSERSTIKTEKEKNIELQSFNQMQINFVAPTYYSDKVVNAGFLRLGFRDGKLSIKKEILENTFESIQGRAIVGAAKSAIPEAGGNHFGDGNIIHLALDPKDPRMGVDKPEPKTARVEEKKPYYESFAAGTQNYMNSISSTPEGFVGLLKEYQQKTNTPAEKKYIDDMIQVINNYNEIDKKKI